MRVINDATWGMLDEMWRERIEALRESPGAEDEGQESEIGSASILEPEFL